MTNLRKSSTILMYASFFGYFAMGLLAPLYAIFVKNIGGSILDIGIAYSIFAIITGIFILTFSRIKFFQKNVRRVIFIGYLLMALCYFSYIFVRNPGDLFVVQIILGIAIGILEPSWDSVFSYGLSEKESIKTWSIWAGGTQIILGISAIVGSLIISLFSFTALFVIMGISCIVSAFISLRLLRES